MDPSFTPLVLTKLHPPALRARAVPRPRLLEKIVPGAGIDLVLVSAPAGYGKTTLLVEWTRQLIRDGISVAWYALDKGDNRPITFGTYLLSGLEQVLGKECGLGPVSQALRAETDADLLKFLPSVINALLASRREVVLVLDDYHLIRTAAIHQAIEFLINYSPVNFHLAIGSRADPPLPLANLRARGRLAELHAGDLRFSLDETEKFLRECLRMDVPVEIASRLSVRMEGWAAGLQLTALSLSGSGQSEALLPKVTGGHKRLAEYLLEEVVDHLPEELQSFLLDTSILERLSAPLCDAILGLDHSSELLKQIEASNLFITALDEEGTWYHYHPLFRDFLKTWLWKTQPELAPMLHRLASAWFADHGLLREAAYHAFQSGDREFAVDFVERYSFDLIIRSEIATIHEWCSAFPEVFLRERPRLCILQGLALAYHFHSQNRRRVEARLEQAERKLSELGDTNLSNEVNALAAVVRTFLAMVPDPLTDSQALLSLAESHLPGFPAGDPAAFPWLLIAGYSLQALHRIGEAEEAFQAALPLAYDAGLFFGVVETTFHLARLAHGQGKLAKARRLCQEAKERLDEAMTDAHMEFPALGCLDIAIADILLEQNLPDEADHHLQSGMRRMGGGMNPYYLATGWLVAFRLAQVQQRLDEALRSLDQLNLLWPDLRFFSQGLRAQAMLLLSPGEEAVQEAKSWLRSYPASIGGHLPLPGLGPIGGAEIYYRANLVWVQLQIMVGDLQEVWPYLTLQLEQSRQSRLTGREIELTLLEAQAYHQTGQEQLALTALEEAFAAGQSENYVRTFFQSSILDDLIHLAVNKEICPPYANQILAAIRLSKGKGRSSDTGTNADSTSGVAGSRPDETLIEPLSERELDILRLMAEGASNQFIAERLVITVGTVKSHINHILRKLRVRNRTEAVAHGRKRKLLDR